MSTPAPKVTPPLVAKTPSHAARARWKLATSMLLTYGWGFIGLAFFQVIIQGREIASWPILVEMGTAITLMVLAIWIAPRGEK